MSLIPHDLTQTQFAALVKLVEVGTCSQNHLGRLIYLDAATIKGVVDRLRVRNLVTIELNPKDRRRSMVAALSEDARSLVYRLSLVIGRFGRTLALKIGEVSPPIPRTMP